MMPMQTVIFKEKFVVNALGNKSIRKCEPFPASVFSAQPMDFGIALLFCLVESKLMQSARVCEFKGKDSSKSRPKITHFEDPNPILQEKLSQNCSLLPTPCYLFRPIH